MNNTELFERIKQDCLNEQIKIAGYTNYSDLEKNAPAPVIGFVFSETDVAMRSF